nr:hypothetical protein Itr_chr09CG12680 [Ipomoea trifida]
MPATVALWRRRTQMAIAYLQMRISQARSLLSDVAAFREHIRVSQMRVSADPHFQFGSWYARFCPWAEATWVCQRVDNGTWAVHQQAELTRPCGLSAGSEPMWTVRIGGTNYELPFPVNWGCGPVLEMDHQTGKNPSCLRWQAHTRFRGAAGVMWGVNVDVYDHLALHDNIYFPDVFDPALELDLLARRNTHQQSLENWSTSNIALNTDMT